MRRSILAAFLVLGACSTPAPDPAPAPPSAPPPPVASAPPPEPDTCGAKAHQHLVGRPRSEVPVPVRPELQRVACTTCPVTMDFNENRLNFFFDAATGLIREVRCG
ncbi:peptidase inhibitor I78 [Phenylobacterium kunshanense]|nr:peptidase inhibitor I78 [Phenylobacterium kunshanense]